MWFNPRESNKAREKLQMAFSVDQLVENAWDAFCSLPYWADSISEAAFKEELRTLFNYYISKARPMSEPPDRAWFPAGPEGEREWREACQR